MRKVIVVLIICLLVGAMYGQECQKNCRNPNDIPFALDPNLTAGRCVVGWQEICENGDYGGQLFVCDRDGDPFRIIPRGLPTWIQIEANGIDLSDPNTTTLFDPEPNELVIVNWWGTPANYGTYYLNFDVHSEPNRDCTRWQVVKYSFPVNVTEVKDTPPFLFVLDAD